MKQKISLTLLFVAIFTAQCLSQALTQTIRGHVFDVDSKHPLAGVQVVVSNEPQKGAITDAEGKFRIEAVPIGRVLLQLSYLGYENLFVPNLVVNSGKEVVIDLEMRELAAKLKEVTIAATQEKGNTVNEMTLLSARSIAPEETNRYAGGFNDPSRILANFAGITNTQDGSNDIIVRGNAPKYVQWRLEGEQITNPNHFGDQSAVGGSVSTLNNNLLATSDFHTGAFAPEFGDALSGVYDVRLRAGNNEKFESVFGFGLLGTELTFEGPFKKGYDGSFLVNYRYSTVGLVSDLGLVDIVSGGLNFQDATFKIVLPTSKAGIFSLYGLGGMSKFHFENVTPAIWVTPGNNANPNETRKDYDKKAHLLNGGIKHSMQLGQNGLLNTSFTYSNEGIEDDIYALDRIRLYDDSGMHLRDSILAKNQIFQSNFQKPTYRSSITYHHKFNARHKIQIGFKYALFDYKVEQNQFSGDQNQALTLLDFHENVSTIRNFVSWRFRASQNLTIVSGLHNMNVLLNKKHTLEPRFAIEWQTTPTSKMQLGYGRHSSMESIHHYFAKIKQPDGTVIEPNRDLDLLKADHFVVGFEKRLGKKMRAKVEIYYQNLFDLPVERLDTSYFSTIVEGLDFRYVDLINAGKGRNYGIEVTLEKFFSQHYYFLLNASRYESVYTPLDGVERNTPFAGKYLVNFLFGKEFPGLGKRKNQLFSLNARMFFGGGRKIIPLLRDAAGNLAVDLDKNKVWDYSKAFKTSLDDPYQIQISMSYKWNKPRTTHELFLNLDNITHHKGKITEFYDETKPDKIGYMTQFGFFPNLMYRVYF